jgi:hypothetical protein
MINILKQSLWKQFGASIDMLKNTIEQCPDESWNTNRKLFYMVYHTLVFLDYYLTIPARPLSSPLPFTLTEPASSIPADAIDDIIPDKIYSKEELLHYLHQNRNKCHDVIAALTEEKLTERWVDPEANRNYAVLELLMYNMRHVQHHAAQMNLLLRQGVNNAPGWVRRAKDDL